MKPLTLLSLSGKNLAYFFLKATGQRHRIVPYKVLLEVTTRCNSRCGHCDIWKIPSAHTHSPDMALMETFFKKMGKHLLWLAFSGGEVTLNKDFPALVALVKKYNPRLRIVTFTSNGLLPKKILEYALLLKEQLRSELFITISLDGDEPTHDSIRGIKGNYTKAMETYRLLQEHGINCHFGLTVVPENTHFIQTRFAHYRNRIKAITFFHTEGIFLTGKERQNPNADGDIRTSLQHIYRQYRVKAPGELLVKLFLKISLRFLKDGRQKNSIPCDAGNSSVHLMANGNLGPCMYLEPFTRLSHDFDIRAFNNAKALALKEEIKKDRCPHCWMNCYAPHSMLQSPLKTLRIALQPA